MLHLKTVNCDAKTIKDSKRLYFQLYVENKKFTKIHSNKKLWKIINTNVTFSSVIIIFCYYYLQ